MNDQKFYNKDKPNLYNWFRWIQPTITNPRELKCTLDFYKLVGCEIDWIHTIGGSEVFIDTDEHSPTVANFEIDGVVLIHFKDGDTFEFKMLDTSVCKTSMNQLVNQFDHEDLLIGDKSDERVVLEDKKVLVFIKSKKMVDVRVTKGTYDDYLLYSSRLYGIGISDK